MELDNTSTTTHVSASVETHQLAIIRTTIIHTLVNATVILTTAIQVSTLTQGVVAASVHSTRPAKSISTSTEPRANVSAVTSRNVDMVNTSTTTHVSANVKTHQLASIRTTIIQIPVNATVILTTAMLVNTSTTRAAGASVQSTRHVLTIST